MQVYTDSVDYAERVLLRRPVWTEVPVSAVGAEIRGLVGELFVETVFAGVSADLDTLWSHLFSAKSTSESQYDALIRSVQSGQDLPGGILCLAGSGGGLHGFKGRPWVALPGNIHLSVFLKPQQKIDGFGPGFTVLAAVSVAEAIDAVRGLEHRATLKWVNDVLIEGTKVAGVLAHTQSQGDMVTGAVLGVGLNVETRPEVERDPFVPEAGALREFAVNAPGCTEGSVFRQLADRLADNYRLLLEGGYDKLLARYRERSAIIGQEVSIFADSGNGPDREIARGTVASIGENLELYLAGCRRPVTKGRLVMKKGSDA